MPYIPQRVPSDFQILFGILGVVLLFLVFWLFSNWIKGYAEKKEKEIEEELKELEQTGELH